MPMELPRSPNMAWLAGCTVHFMEVKVHGRSFQALLDSGNAVSLIQPAVLPPRAKSKVILSITCVHGDMPQVLAQRVNISAPHGAWPVKVGIVTDLPVPVLPGRDWPGFDHLLAAATQPASPVGKPLSMEAKVKSQPSFPTGVRRGRIRKRATRGRSPQALLDTSESDRGKGGLASAPSDSSLHRPEWPALLCRTATGGGKDSVGGTAGQD